MAQKIKKNTFFYPKAAAEQNNKLLQTGQTTQGEPGTNAKKRKETQANENNNVLSTKSNPTKSILCKRHASKVIIHSL